MISAALESFARLLGIKDDQAEDALVSERAARLVLSRRSLLGVAGALTTGALFSFGKSEPEQIKFLREDGTWVVPTDSNIARSTLSSFDAFMKERYLRTAEEFVWRDDPYLIAIRGDSRKQLVRGDA